MIIECRDEESCWPKGIIGTNSKRTKDRFFERWWITKWEAIYCEYHDNRKDLKKWRKRRGSKYGNHQAGWTEAFWNEGITTPTVKRMFQEAGHILVRLYKCVGWSICPCCWKNSKGESDCLPPLSGDLEMTKVMGRCEKYRKESLGGSTSHY